MTRRALFQILTAQPQSFGPTNTPQCPLCRTPLPLDFPAYVPLVGNADGAPGALVNSRDCICGTCGNRWIVAVK